MRSSTSRRLARGGTAGLALGLMLGVTPTLTAQAAPGNDLTGAPKTGAQENIASAGPASAQMRTVTLITGDRVQVRDGAKVESVLPGSGRQAMSFSISHLNDHLHVVPRDAARLIAEGRLDRRLFDITTLIGFGYDDAETDTIPLIVKHATGQPRTPSPVAANAVTAPRELTSVASSAVRTKKATATKLWSAIAGGSATSPTARTMSAAGVTKIGLDGQLALSLDRSVAQIGAPTAWQAGLTGAGVKVAVLDSGVDGKHPDLVGREVAEKNFTEAPDNTDDVGHGTHVAATIASTGAKAAGRYKGVAPGVALLDGKVCTPVNCSESAVLAGMEWAAAQGAKVINMSLGGQDTPEIDPVEEAVNVLSAKHGALFVVAAGNWGPAARTVASPASADAALTVGAVDRDERIAEFSSRGPRVADAGIKPDITAPGVDIVAAKSAASGPGKPGENGYVSMSGTSMAAPHVAGAAAILAQQHPNWTGAQIKAALTASARPNPALSVFEQGSGRVDVAKAITQTMTTEPSNVNLGIQQWPHDDDKPVTKTVNYRNSGAAEVTLSLSLEATGPAGKPAPAGMFTVSPARVTVPAGGEATVTVTADTTRGSVDGVFAGALVASVGASALRTPVTVTREVESYQLTVNHLDRTGATTDEYADTLLAIDSGEDIPLRGPNGRATVRLPKGKYVLHSIIDTPVDGESARTLLTQPLLTIDRNSTVTLDARAGKPVELTSPEPSATPLAGEVSIARRLGNGKDYRTSEWAFLRPLKVWTAHLGPPVPAAELSAMTSMVWGPKRTAEPMANPTLYGLAWSQTGKVYTGFRGTAEKNRLAEVKLQSGPVPAGYGVSHSVMPFGKNDNEGLGTPVPLQQPASVTMYLGGENTQWSTRFEQYGLSSPGGDSASWQVSPAKSYQPGRRYQERLNFAVFGPALPADREGWVNRRGDELLAGVPLFGDSGGNAGFSQVTSAHTRLWRDGQLIGDIPNRGGTFTVPAGGGAYRLAVEANRAGVSDVSNQVSGVWTFRSAHVDASSTVPLPVSVIRFNPKLNDSNAAPAGRLFHVPISTQSQPGAGKVRLSVVEVSYDDGETWQQVPVVANNALLLHPKKAGFVSLRAKAHDSRGNTVDQTIIRAYKLTQALHPRDARGPSADRS